MMDNEPEPKPKTNASSLQRAIWRGSSIIAPPLVTLLLLIWLGSAIEQYVLLPLETASRTILVWTTADILDDVPQDAILQNEQDATEGFTFEGTTYIQPPIGRNYLPRYVITKVDNNLDHLPATMQSNLSANNYYHSYIKLLYMPRWFTVPLLLLVLLAVLFFVGRFLAAGVGRLFVNLFEKLINKLPFIRNLYGSVKQVTDFILSEREIEFTRVVAIEYPRVGIWSLGFVTSDSLPPLRHTLNEELVSIFVPTSPMPMTGFTVNVRKREVIDLELTIDQAVQFIVSCGVVCPPMTKVGQTSPALLGDPLRSDSANLEEPPTPRSADDQ